MSGGRPYGPCRLAGMQKIDAIWAELGMLD